MNDGPTRPGRKPTQLDAKPCPFCQGEASLVSGYFLRRRSVSVRCIDCGARGPEVEFGADENVYDMEAGATKKWNDCKR